MFATVPSDHDLCGIGIYTHNLEASPAAQKDLGDALKVFADLGYVREQDIPLIPVLKNRPQAVIYGPLSQVPLPPGCGAAVRECGSDVDPFRGFAAVGGRFASGHGTSGLRGGAASFE